MCFMKKSKAASDCMTALSSSPTYSSPSHLTYTHLAISDKSFGHFVVQLMLQSFNLKGVGEGRNSGLVKWF